jgi:hypothetical protein
MFFPNPFQLNNYCLPNTQYHIPPKNGEFNIHIEGPVGTDQIIAVASDKPIPKTLLTQSKNLETIKNQISQLGLQHTTIKYQVIN